MPRIISGLRVARSFVTPASAAIESRELDFQLGSNQGIEVLSVLGYGLYADASPATSDTVPVHSIAVQSLHLETGTLESVPALAAEEEDDIDTEIFYVQTYGLMFQVPATAGGGGGTLLVTPTGMVDYKEPIRTARNITHRGECFATGATLEAGVLIFYRYIEFSNNELGFFLARRQ